MQSNGYNKRPMWQWILIYLIIGGVIYGIIYFLVLSKNGENNNTGGQPNSQQNIPY